MTQWLVCWTVNGTVLVLALAKFIVLCSWATQILLSALKAGDNHRPDASLVSNADPQQGHSNPETLEICCLLNILATIG